MAIGSRRRRRGTADFQNVYTYDPLSRLTKVVQKQQAGGAFVDDKRVEFAYDAAGQMNKLTRRSADTAGNLVTTSDYVFDRSGLYCRAARPAS